MSLARKQSRPVKQDTTLLKTDSKAGKALQKVLDGRDSRSALSILPLWKRSHWKKSLMSSLAGIREMLKVYWLRSKLDLGIFPVTDE